MEQSDKHRLEGLLQARSAVLGESRRARAPREPAASSAAPVTTTTAVALPPLEPSSAAPSSARACDDCGEAIEPRRLRAMPRAVRCLACQRSTEEQQPPP